MVKRYRVSYGNGVVEDKGNAYHHPATHSQPMVMASDYDTLKQCYDGVVNAGNKLIAERDSLLVDAQRYRWLRERHGEDGSWRVMGTRGLYKSESLSFEDLDAAIDQARAK